MAFLIKEIPLEERPREKLIKYGKDTLSNIELLAIIIKNGLKGQSVLELASQIIFSLENIQELESISVQELIKIKGIGKAKATEIIASIELSKRILSYKKDNLRLTSPKIIFEYFKNTIIKDQEQIIVLYLDTKGHLMSKKTLFIGSLNETPIHPREIFKWACKLSAMGIILIHNHPSGDEIPSNADIEITKQIIDCAKLMKIEVLDHIIFGNNYYSFREHNLF